MNNLKMHDILNYLGGQIADPAVRLKIEEARRSDPEVAKQFKILKDAVAADVEQDNEAMALVNKAKSPASSGVRPVRMTQPRPEPVETSLPVILARSVFEKTMRFSSRFGLVVTKGGRTDGTKSKRLQASQGEFGLTEDRKSIVFDFPANKLDLPHRLLIIIWRTVDGRQAPPQLMPVTLTVDGKRFQAQFPISKCLPPDYPVESLDRPDADGVTDVPSLLKLMSVDAAVDQLDRWLKSGYVGRRPEVKAALEAFKSRLESPQ
jgi:hypothetical protein